MPLKKRKHTFQSVMSCIYLRCMLDYS